MKILCDVCAGDEAAVFCCADEAALCASCDHRVHRANKLSVKHSRFSLLPSAAAAAAASSHHPLCDICQDRRGLIFCQEDRAILCTECDSPIHASNKLTMKHNRFILTGIRLPAATSTPPELSSIPTPTFSKGSENTEPITKTTAEVDSISPADSASNNGSSSISEYLTKLLPGYCVEDLLINDTMIADGDAFYEEDDELLPFAEANSGGNGMAEGFPNWVPQVPRMPPLHPSQLRAGGGDAAHMEQGGEDYLLLAAEPGRHHRWEEDVFAVPQLPAVVTAGSKRERGNSDNGYF